MNYLPKEWQNGDIITADSLDALENGISENSQFSNVIANEIDGIVASTRGNLEGVSESSAKTLETGGIDPETGEDDDTQTDAKRTGEFRLSGGDLVSFKIGTSTAKEDIKLFFYKNGSCWGFTRWKCNEKYIVPVSGTFRVVCENGATLYVTKHSYSFTAREIPIYASDDPTIRFLVTVNKKGEISVAKA